MANGSDTRIDNPERLCDAIAEIIDELEAAELIEDERASELRSDVYRSIDRPEE